MSQTVNVNLLVPAVTVKLGFLKIDPIKHVLGMSLEEVLSTLLLGPVERMPSPNGRGLVDVYRLGLPEGEGSSIPLGNLGELGFWNEGGLPIGTQVATKFGDEATLFRLAGQLERARPWAHRKPPNL